MLWSKIVNVNQDYFFADPSTIVQPPENKVELPSKDVCFTVAWSDISNIIKAAAIYQIEDLAVVGDGQTVKLVVRDKKNDTSNNYAVKVGVTDKEFVSISKLKTLSCYLAIMRLLLVSTMHLYSETQTEILSISSP